LSPPARFGARGSALPETALVMPLAMLVLYGLVQISLTTFYQLSADGASFAGAQKSVALDGAAASLTTARTIATGLFTHVASADIGVATPGPASTASAVFETSVSKTVAGLGVPGFPTTQSIQSRVVEPGVGSATSLGPIHFCAKTTGGAQAFSLANTVNGVQSGVTPIVNETTGAINTSALTAHIADLQGVATGLSGIQSALAQLNSALTQIAQLPGGNTLVNGVLNTALSAVQPVLNSALAGTASSGGIAGLGTTLNALLGPVEATVTLLGHSTLANQLASSTIRPKRTAKATSALRPIAA
jgi:hypothetical protein